MMLTSWCPSLGYYSWSSGISCNLRPNSLDTKTEGEDYQSELLLVLTKTLNLTCTVFGNPDPEVVWFKNDKAFERNEHYAFSLEQGKYASLTIKGVTSEDSGKYSIHVKNKYGGETVDVTYEGGIVVWYCRLFKNLTVLADNDEDGSIVVSNSSEKQNDEGRIAEKEINERNIMGK
ncbi:myomesin-2 [Limosa lapponica baueri]|uniref:Myomesin-2 n=1 Tax=Limosa lapponica baueri TaxID=1758121 RepID=A0A2I0U8F2_LIMLA|nr:myomesin-2 [Limosa lapponica baueri]